MIEYASNGDSKLRDLATQVEAASKRVRCAAHLADEDNGDLGAVLDEVTNFLEAVASELEMAGSSSDDTVWIHPRLLTRVRSLAAGMDDPDFDKGIISRGIVNAAVARFLAGDVDSKAAFAEFCRIMDCADAVKG